MHITAFITTLLSFLALALASQHQQPVHDHHTTTTMSKSLNVFKKPLALHSTQPMTGFLRNGYCEVPGADYGNHAIAATVTEEFLDFSAKQGNDLRPIPGMQGGCKWCLCVSRWKEAFDARKNHPQGDQIVPKIFLNATNEKALGKVSLDELKQFAADKEE
ncbi:hypothetical protein Q7P37_004129 [Cladosporium fusiforme]